MSKARRDFVDILIRNDVPVPDRVIERLTRTTGGTSVTLQEPLVLWHYASETEVMQAIATFHKLEFINLEEVEIPPAIISFMPESMAREHVVLPLAIEGNCLKIVTSDPTAQLALQTMSFILNSEIRFAVADREQILLALDRYYPPEAEWIH